MITKSSHERKIGFRQDFSEDLWALDLFSTRLGPLFSSLLLFSPSFSSPQIFRKSQTQIPDEFCSEIQEKENKLRLFQVHCSSRPLDPFPPSTILAHAPFYTNLSVERRHPGTIVSEIHLCSQNRFLWKTERIFKEMHLQRLQFLKDRSCSNIIIIRFGLDVLCEIVLRSKEKI